MPILANPKHERFAQELARGKSASEAYVIAGYKANTGNAATLKAQESVSKRVLELVEERNKMAVVASEKAAEALSIDRQWVMQALLDDRAKARELEQISPAIRALELLGKELGMFVDRTENVNINHDVSDQPISDEQWADEHAVKH